MSSNLDTYKRQKEEGVHFYQNLKGVVNFCHASLAYIFHKCHKNVVFMKNN